MRRAADDEADQRTRWVVCTRHREGAAVIQQASCRPLVLAVGAGALPPPCGRAGAAAPTVEPGSRPAAIRHRFRSRSEADTLGRSLPELIRRFPSVTVTMEPFPGGKYQTKVAALMPVRSPGDAQCGANVQSRSATWVYLGGSSAPDGSMRSERFLPIQYHLATIDGGTRHGKFYRLPFKLHRSMCLACPNASVLEETGLVAPASVATREQVLELAWGEPGVDVHVVPHAARGCV